MNYRNEYEKWLRSEYFDEQTTNELKSIKLDEVTRVITNRSFLIATV